MDGFFMSSQEAFVSYASKAKGARGERRFDSRKDNPTNQ
jgi:hypothetical protein